MSSAPFAVRSRPIHDRVPSRAPRREPGYRLAPRGLGLLGLGPLAVVLLLSAPGAAGASLTTTWTAPYTGAPIVQHSLTTCGGGGGSANASANRTTGNVSASVAGWAYSGAECARAVDFAGFNLTYTANQTSKARGDHAPAVRADSEMVYDAADRYTVLFGGCVVLYCGGVANDTWKFDSGVWSQLKVASHPAARSDAAMVYDARDQYVLLFGGTSLTSNASFDDTWEFSKGAWTNITPTISPSARFGAGIAYDARDHCVVLFGGSRAWNAPNTTLYNDTWIFAAGRWTNVTLAHSPSVRQPGQAMTYDAKDGYVVLFGGYVAGGWTLGDTWTFSRGVWTNVSGIAPIWSVSPPSTFTRSEPKPFRNSRSALCT